MRKRVTLITGAAGEIGQALIKKLATDNVELLTLDLNTLPADLANLSTHMEMDLLDKNGIERLVTEYEIDTIYHLAALLSSRSEYAPELAHRVNVEGTLSLLKIAAEQSQRLGESVKFIFPSSIAIYGLPDMETKSRDRWVKEWDWNDPVTMYGCNKLYCEQVGTYYSRHYQQLSRSRPTTLDFRSVRFPGLISAFTVPAGGTSDYGPEMLHAAAKGEPYACFVREDSIIPFMAMPDGVTALLKLAEAPREALSRSVYNVTSFSLTAVDFQQQVLQAFPSAQISFDPDEKRQRIVDSWPADLSDQYARTDWGWDPAYNLDRAFNEYLIPNIRQRYQ